MYLPCHHQAGWGSSRRRPVGRFDWKCFALIQRTTDKVSVPEKIAPAILGVVAAVALFAACGSGAADKTAAPSQAPTPEPTATPTALVIDEYPWELWEPQSLSPDELMAQQHEAEAPVKNPWTQDELDALALTLAGECYEDKPHDKRKVCEVVLNRVSVEGFGDSILAVLTAPSQFNGYWQQSRPVLDNDYAVAEQALKDWYDNDCKPLSQYLYFCAGKNRENVFRAEF